MALGGSMQAMIRATPLLHGQTRGSTSYTCLRRRAQGRVAAEAGILLKPSMVVGASPWALRPPDTPCCTSRSREPSGGQPSEYARCVPATRRRPEPWRGLFKPLGLTEQFQAIVVEHLQDVFQQALALRREYELR
jgi:hypothetical protein